MYVEFNMYSGPEKALVTQVINSLLLTGKWQIDGFDLGSRVNATEGCGERKMSVAIMPIASVDSTG